MGAETSSTHLIFFIVAMIIAAGVAGVIFTNVNAVANATQSASGTLSKQLQTDITIINDPGNIPKSGDIYTFYVKNTGKSTLTTELVSVLINGVYIPDDDVQKTVIGGGTTTVWRTSEVLQLDVTYASMPSGDNDLRLITENGVDDSFEFTI
ncbi:flagellar protein G [candidate division WOR-3 bacterium]|nr:flagellar protein G [candidate division WOR-3 bacterium]